MDDKANARPVFGEIMTAGLKAGQGAEQAARPTDIIDADFETLHAGPSAVNAASPASFSASVGSGAGGLDTLRPAAVPGAVRGRRGGPSFWSFGLVLVFLAFWISGGHSLLRHLPAFGDGALPPGLRIASLTTHVEAGEGRPVLFVDGEAVNDAEEVQTLPTLAINVLDGEGRTTRYFLGTNQRRLAQGERFSFSSRLVAPKGGVKSVSVSFRQEEE